MTADQLLARLKVVVPQVAISIDRNEDDEAVWEGPEENDPADRGLYPYVVTITAQTIIEGLMYAGEGVLTDTYYKDDEPIGEMGGYLPQKLEEALKGLRSDVRRGNSLVVDQVVASLNDGIGVLKQEMKDRYKAEQAAKFTPADAELLKQLEAP